MVEKNNAIRTILASVFITLILSGVGMYFGMPLLFPNLNADLNEYKDECNCIYEDRGNLLQIKSVEVNTVDYINDFNLTYTKIPGMELDITTNGNSSLYVTLEGLFFLYMDSSFAGFTGYNISLVVSGIGNRTTIISYYTQVGPSSFFHQSHNIFITYETGIISAGNYTISAYWRSIYDTPGSITSLTTEVQNTYHSARKIFVQEFAAV
ncbi:MAG: hypothetical protein ACTSWX_02160 [Promethearchaeota archaeon]